MDGNTVEDNMLNSTHPVMKVSEFRSQPLLVIVLLCREIYYIIVSNIHGNKVSL